MTVLKLIAHLILRDELDADHRRRADLYRDYLDVKNRLAAAERSNKDLRARLNAAWMRP